MLTNSTYSSPVNCDVLDTPSHHTPCVTHKPTVAAVRTETHYRRRPVSSIHPFAHGTLHSLWLSICHLGIGMLAERPSGGADSWTTTHDLFSRGDCDAPPLGSFGCICSSLLQLYCAAWWDKLWCIVTLPCQVGLSSRPRTHSTVRNQLECLVAGIMSTVPGHLGCPATASSPGCFSRQDVVAHKLRRPRYRRASRKLHGRTVTSYLRHYYGPGFLRVPACSFGN